MICDCCKNDYKDFIITKLYTNNIFEQESKLCKKCSTIQTIYMAKRCEKEAPLTYKKYLQTASEHLKRDFNYK
jgi:hypothetical protein